MQMNSVVTSLAAAPDPDAYRSAQPAGAAASGAAAPPAGAQVCPTSRGAARALLRGRAAHLGLGLLEVGCARLRPAQHWWLRELGHARPTAGAAAASPCPRRMRPGARAPCCARAVRMPHGEAKASGATLCARWRAPASSRAQASGRLLFSGDPAMRGSPRVSDTASAVSQARRWAARAALRTPLCQPDRGPGTPDGGLRAGRAGGRSRRGGDDAAPACDAQPRRGRLRQSRRRQGHPCALARLCCDRHHLGWPHAIRARARAAHGRAGGRRGGGRGRRGGRGACGAERSPGRAAAGGRAGVRRGGSAPRQRRPPCRRLDERHGRRAARRP